MCLALLILAGCIGSIAHLHPFLRYLQPVSAAAGEAAAYLNSEAVSALGLTLVEGSLRHRDKVYLLTLRGAQPTAGSTGNVYGLVQARDIEGSYKLAIECSCWRRTPGRRGATSPTGASPARVARPCSWSASVAKLTPRLSEPITTHG